MIDCLRNIIGDSKIEVILLNNIEKAHHMLNHQLRRNSERDIPRGSARNGFLKNTLVNASERCGNLFCLLCLCHTDQISGSLKDVLSNKIILLKNFIQCIQLYLSFEEWLHMTNPKDEVESSRPVIFELVKLIKTSFPRTDNDGAIVGQGWKFPKMHALTKFLDYMILFGSAINFFGGFDECNHKKFVKDTGCNTQKRINTFTTQRATRYYESMIFNLATQCISRRNTCLFGVTEENARNNQFR
jgi:hypothetical protein